MQLLAFDDGPDLVGVEAPLGVQGRRRPPAKSMLHMPHWAAPCMSGATIRQGRAKSSGRDLLLDLLGLAESAPQAAERAAKKMSSWRHITPFGMPVVPPV